jgi:hypothetical protein
MRRKVLYNTLIDFEVPMKYVRLIKTCLNGTYSKICICRHFSDRFFIQNGLKQGDVSLSVILYFALEYAIRKVQDNQVRLELNGTHQLLAYAGDVNLQGDNMDTVKINIETLMDAR